MPKSYFHNQKPIYENKNQTKITPVFNVVTKRAVDINILLNRVKIEKKNATLFVTYPSYQATSYDKSIKQIKRVEKELMNNNLELLGTPERYRMQDTMMFDTPYHLLKKGVDFRTELLIEDLKKVRTHNNVYKK